MDPLLKTRNFDSHVSDSRKLGKLFFKALESRDLPSRNLDTRVLGLWGEWSFFFSEKLFDAGFIGFQVAFKNCLRLDLLLCDKRS